MCRAGAPLHWLSEERNDCTRKADGRQQDLRLGDVRVRALAGIDLAIDRGDFIALAGPSGSGKTTLLNLIGCIDKPDSGRIVIDERRRDARPAAPPRLAAPRHPRVHLPDLQSDSGPDRVRERRVSAAARRRAAPRARRARPSLARPGRARRSRRSSGPINSPADSGSASPSPARWSPSRSSSSPTSRPRISTPTPPRTSSISSASSTRRPACTFVFSTHDPSLIARAERVVRMRDGRITDIERPARAWPKEITCHQNRTSATSSATAAAPRSRCSSSSSARSA